MFSLPRNWVFVHFADGTSENVANQDTLTEAEARKFAEYWSKARNKTVVAVLLVNNQREPLKLFHI